MKPEHKFLAFALEFYRHKKNMSGAEVAKLFSKHDIYQLIIDNYYLYHIESPEHMVFDIDHFIETGKVYDPLTTQ